MPTEPESSGEAVETTQGENSMSIFETMTREEWVEAGAGSNARKGEYAGILSDFLASGQPYARISTDAGGNGRFAGKDASQVATSLKQARDSKSAPEGVDSIQVSSRKGVVFLENQAVTQAA